MSDTETTMAKKAVSGKPAASGALREAIAERAYFKAEQRGFVPGAELEDWLEAERELLAPAVSRSRPRRRKAAAAATA